MSGAFFVFVWNSFNIVKLISIIKTSNDLQIGAFLFEKD